MDSFKKLLSIINKGKGIIVLFVIISLIWSGVYVTFFYTPNYISKSRLWVKKATAKNFITDSNFENFNNVDPLSMTGNPILTQIEILKSSQMNDRLTKFVDAHYPELNPDKKILDFSSSLKIKNKIGTDIIELYFTWNDPEVAQALLKEIVFQYKDIVTETNRNNIKKRRKYIDVRVDEIEQELDKVRFQIKQYKEANKVIIVDKEAEELVVNKNELLILLTKAQMEKDGLSREIYSLQKQLGVKNADVKDMLIGYDNKILIDLQAELNRAMQEKIEKQSVWADTNPKLIAINEKVDYLTERIADINGKTIQGALKVFDPVKSEVVRNLAARQAEYQSLVAQEKAVRYSLENVASTYDRLPEVEYTLNNLMQKEKNLSLAFDEMKLKQMEAALSEADVTSNIFDIDPPTFSKEPIPPTRVQYVILSVILGLFFGFAFAMLKNELNDECDSIEDIEDITKKPIIGSIPWINAMMSEQERADLLAISYRNIVNNLLFGTLKNNTKVIAFTSPFVRFNTGGTIFDLATILAMQNYKVAFLDNNFRNPSVANTRGLELKENFSDTLIRIEAALSKKLPDEDIKVDVKKFATQLNNNLFVYANKDLVDDPYAFFSSDAYAFFINKIRKEFDWVIVDTPSGMLPVEFPIIARLSDGVIFLHSKKIKQSKLKFITKMLSSYSINLIGSIIREDEKSFVSKM